MYNIFKEINETSMYWGQRVTLTRFDFFFFPQSERMRSEVKLKEKEKKDIHASD